MEEKTRKINQRRYEKGKKVKGVKRRKKISEKVVMRKKVKNYETRK